MNRSLRRLRAGVPALLAAVALSLGAAGSAAAAAAPPPSTHSTAAHSVIVTGSPEAVRAAKAYLHADTARGYVDLPVIGGFGVQVTDAQRAALTARGVHVSDNAPVKLTDADFGQDSRVASAIYPQVDGAAAGWSEGVDGRGVTVAVIDTGISNTGDLAGKVVDGYDFSGEGDYTRDSFGHGTFVAGTIAGTGAASDGAVKGVAPGAKLVSLKIAGADGSTDVLRVITAVQWAVNHAEADNIRVLNLSLGTDSTQDWRIDPLNAAVEGAWRHGMVVTVAAGNSGSAGISKPGDDPYVITVGATDDATTLTTSDDSVAPFSSTGPTAQGIAKPDLVAPGAHVVSTRVADSAIDTQFPSARVADAYFKGSGTSFSAPQVAGAAALMLQQHPNLTPNQVKGQLKATAAPLAGATAAQQGAGELSIDKALSAPLAGSGNDEGRGYSNGSGSAVESQGSLRHAPAPTGTDSAAWNSAAWNSAAWNSAAWNSAAWNSAAWNSAAWNSAAWNSAAWNSAAWNSAAWNSAAWNSAAWNSAAWNSAAWNSAAWNSAGWASAGFWSAAWN